MKQRTPRANDKAAVRKTEMGEEGPQLGRNIPTWSFNLAIKKGSSQDNTGLEVIENFVNIDFYFSGLFGLM